MKTKILLPGLLIIPILVACLPIQSTSNRSTGIDIDPSTNTSQPTIINNPTETNTLPTAINKLPTPTKRLPTQIIKPTTTQSSSAPCTCSRDYDCKDFKTQKESQKCFTYCKGTKTNNWSNLDSDHDGKACESLP